jgi:uncharacterized repeat protein (TIGR02543 family)
MCNRGIAFSIKWLAVLFLVSACDMIHMENPWASNGSDRVAVERVWMTRYQPEIALGMPVLFQATVSPDDAENKKIRWSTSDAAVATVDSSGLVSGVALGNVTITVTAADGGISESLNIAVVPPVYLDAITLNKTSTVLLVGTEEQLNPLFNPLGATNKNVTWGSDNTGVATVSSTGLVRAVSAGTATITVTADDDFNGIHTATCIVTVTITQVPATGISLSPPTLALKDNTIGSITASVIPATATNQNINWSSLDTDVAIVTGGIVTTVSAGTANIIATTADGGFTASCRVTVTDYTVSFDSQEGSPIESVQVPYGEKIPEPSDPNRTHYSFMGWYLEPVCTNPWNFDSDLITGDRTLYAKWTPVSYTLSFNSRGGSSVGSLSVVYNTLASAPGAPDRNGYTFQGWYREEACTNAWNFGTDRVLSNTTLYARWALVTYSITYNLDGGTNNGANPSGYTIESAAITLADPTKTNYAFTGWYSDSGFTTPVSTIPEGSTGNRTFYAKWVEQRFTVTFNPNGGTGTMSAQDFFTGVPDILTANTFNCDHFTFAGWAVTSNGAAVYFDESSFTIGTSNVTLYAVWNWDPLTNLTDLAEDGHLEMISMQVAVAQPLFYYVHNNYLPKHSGGSYTQSTSTTSGFTHHITPFSIGKFEVSYDLWYTVRLWAESNGYTFAHPGMAGNVTGGGTLPDYNNAGLPPTVANRRQPVTVVSWRDCMVWCNAYSQMSGLTPCYYTNSSFTTVFKTVNRSTTITPDTPGSQDAPYVNWNANGYRFPTEGEWQYAASCAGAYPFDYASGATANTHNSAATGLVAWYSTNSGGNSRVIGNRTSNSFGLHDMNGNVAERCWDWDGTLPSDGATVIDFSAANINDRRIMRGGYFNTEYAYIHLGQRTYVGPHIQYVMYGLRVVRRP